ncbi:MAG: coenzyme F420-0:L-glutamate ligase [Candidatus Nezhaarchaeales archaeon]
MGRVVRWREFMAIPLRSNVWRPGTKYKEKIAELVSGVVSSGDYVVISEKALSVALGLLYDESSIKSDPYSKLITYLTTNVLWGLLLSRLCRLSNETISLLRRYPLLEGSRHKKLALRIGGILQAFKPTSEAGIDATNLPRHLVSLPLNEPFKVADEIRSYLFQELKVDVRVAIVDSDKCYRLKPIPKLILTSRKSGLPLSMNLGVISFLIARSLNNLFSPYATPVGFSPTTVDIDELLIVSELADRARGFGIGRTVHEVEKKLKVKAIEVTWDLLDSFPHYPVVVVKRIKGLR